MNTHRDALRTILLIGASLALTWATAAALGTPGAGLAEATVQPDPPEVGSEAPGFELESIDGETYALGQLRGESPLLLVFFRGAW